jgi:hypothetical protein
VRAWLAAALGAAWAGALAAQSPADPHAVQPERPTVATHAYEVSPGWVEVEAGAELDRYAEGSHGGSGPVVLKFGVVPRVQVELQGALVAPPGGTAGPGDLTAAIKWRPFRRSALLGDVAFQPSITLPTGSATRGTGTGATAASFLLISSRQLGPVELDLNVGYTRRTGDGSSVPRDAALWTVSAGGPVAAMVGWVAECFGYPATSGPAGAPATVAVLLGPTLLLRPWLAFDAGIIRQVTGPQPNALYFGVVWNAGWAWGR